MKCVVSFRAGRSSLGFSLIEILAVLVIIGIIATVSIPMLRGPSLAGKIKSSAELLKSELLLARQQAITLNGGVEVRFFQKTSLDPYAAYQVFTVEENGTRTPFSKLQTLPEGVILSADETLSPLLFESLLKGTQSDGVPAVKDWSYTAVLLRSSGEFVDLNRDKAFVTLLEERAPKVSGNLPANYAVVRIEPLTGMVSITQP